MSDNNFLEKQVMNYMKFLQSSGIKNVKVNRYKSKKKQQTNDPLHAEWKLIEDAVANCTKCPLHSTRTNTVFGEGNKNADLMFVGEGPGRDEDLSGRPFIGRAGKLLTKIIEGGLKMDRLQDVFICNIVKCRPPENRNPAPNEVACCIDYLKKQIQLVKPKVIIALGSVAATTLLDTKETIGQLRKKELTYEGVKLIATYHPAYLLRSPNKKVEVWADIKDVPKLLKKL